jgi:hypothetical protein
MLRLTGADLHQEDIVVRHDLLPCFLGVVDTSIEDVVD